MNYRKSFWLMWALCVVGLLLLYLFVAVGHIAIAYAGVLCMLAGLGQTLVYIVYYYNLRRFPVWIVKVFLLLMPIVSTLICFLLFKEKLATMQLLGITVVLAGAFGILMEQKKKARCAGE